jgi:hypothetical protein
MMSDGFEIIDTNTVTGLSTELNAVITEKDVLEAIKCLKNNKACSTDTIYAIKLAYLESKALR